MSRLETLCHSPACLESRPLPLPVRQAIAADPRNPLAKFERATVLMAEERYRDALAELHALKVRLHVQMLHACRWRVWRCICSFCTTRPAG